MSSITASGPYRLSPRARMAGIAAFALLLTVSLGMFALALYGAAMQGAFADCASIYFAPGSEDHCANWRAGFEGTGMSPAGFQIYFLIVRVAAAAPFMVLSVLLVRQRNDELRVLLLAGLLVLLGVAGPTYNPFWQWASAWFTEADQVPLIFHIDKVLNLLLSVGVVLFALLFPDGRFVPRWSRWVAVIWALERAGDIFFPDTPASIYTWPFSFGVIFGTAVPLFAVGNLVWRYRFRSTPAQRQQIKWIVMGGLLLGFSYLLDYGVWEIYPALTGEYLIVTTQQGILWELVQDTLWYVSQFIFGICVGIAVFRHRLWDIDLILSRTLVYGTLTVSIAALYVVIVGGLGAVFHTQTTAFNGLVATGIIAVLFQPLRERLQRVVNRLLYGERDDPAEVLTRLAHQLETSDTRGAILPNLMQTIATALKIPYVAVRLSSDGQDAPVIAWGSAAAQAQVIPLVYQNEAVGQLRVAARGPQENFNRHEQRLLATIAALTAATVRAVQLSDEVNRSRQRIVTAREEERRRIRRDLHDGLGPALAGLPLKIDAAVDLIVQDQQTSVNLLKDVKRHAQQLVADVRRVVHDLRPPALDELGLEQSLRGALTHLSSYPNGLQFDLSADGVASVLPAAIEAAAYRITMEAATNAVKHARAQHCWIRLQSIGTPPCLEIHIEDDGSGISPGAVPNVGLISMRERAEELGGTFQITTRPAGGTRIAVALPFSERGEDS